MRAKSGRKKKLIVAFHFLRSEQAGWTCEQCRRQGLEKKRRCGFLPEAERAPEGLVWIRGNAAAVECPKSLVTPQSIERVERFFARKHFGAGPPDDVGARDADAFLALEQEWQKEQTNGQQS